jgi:hypothetical protein
MSAWSSLFFRATRFEREQQIVLRALIVGAAFLTYLGDRDDVVWRFIKNDGVQTRPIEHWLFLAATFLIGIALHRKSQVGTCRIGGENPSAFCSVLRRAVPLLCRARLTGAVGRLLHSHFRRGGPSVAAVVGPRRNPESSSHTHGQFVNTV